MRLKEAEFELKKNEAVYKDLMWITPMAECHV